MSEPLESGERTERTGVSERTAVSRGGLEKRGGREGRKTCEKGGKNTLPIVCYCPPFSQVLTMKFKGLFWGVGGTKNLWKFQHNAQVFLPQIRGK